MQHGSPTQLWRPRDLDFDDDAAAAAELLLRSAARSLSAVRSIRRDVYDEVASGWDGPSRTTFDLVRELLDAQSGELEARLERAAEDVAVGRLRAASEIEQRGLEQRAWDRTFEAELGERISRAVRP
ncbi:MAG: hypothetical protein S0880_23875 [Actinomycetota bacterium]|nr:hypothetical protein [Actinomycetota bacterium]